MPDISGSAVTQKIRRLTAMSSAEITGRLREKTLAELERCGIPVATADLPSPDFKAWLGKARGRFYPGVVDHLPNRWAKARATQDAEAICRHELQLLGLPAVLLGDRIDWHRDPCSGAQWEIRFWADYKPQDDPRGRDVKVIYELNRHQHLPRLAAAYKSTGDERYVAEIISQLESWVDQNPTGRGINWQSSLELAIRSISWMWTLFLILDSPSLKPAVTNRIGRSLFSQIQHIYRHLSTFTSPNTHLIGEAATLLIAGLVFEGHPSAAAWLGTGRTILNQEAQKQVLDTAVYGELSSWYHCYAVDFYLQAAILSRHNARPLSDAALTSLEGMIDYLMHLTRPDGTIPLLGDDDGGRAFPLGRRDYRSYTEAMALGGLLFRRPDFKCQAGELPEEAFWLFGARVTREWRDLDTYIPERTSVFFPNAGYAIHRTDWSAGASHLVFDCGGLGILTGGHAHADALSVSYFSEGQELLVDPATFVYNCSPEWRAYFRSTAAHNTVTVDGQSQVAQAGTFAWASRLNVRTLTSPSIRWQEAEHEGYAALGVTHRRSIFNAGDYWVLLDRFTGSGSHRFDFHYHLNPAIAPRLVGSEDIVELEAEACNFNLAIHATVPLNAGLHIGETEPISGWASNAYGERHPIPTLCATMAQDLTAASAGAITILTARGKVQRIVPVVLEKGQGIACAVNHESTTDLIIFAPGGGNVTAAGVECCGGFCWQRNERGNIRDAFSVRSVS